eukprot:jgi/Botrbrau1/13367/Bobra.0194s0001.1
MPEIVNGEPQYEVEKILGDRLRGAQLEFLVHWKGYSQEHNSWEPAEALLEHCEDLVNEYWGQPRAHTQSRGRKPVRAKSKPQR